MAMKSRWLKSALQQLDQEADFIAENNPKAAIDFVAQVVRQTELLKSHPQLGRSGRVLGTRELIIHGYLYLIPYRIRENTVELLRVFHTARQYPPKK